MFPILSIRRPNTCPKANGMITKKKKKATGDFEVMRGQDKCVSDLGSDHYL